MLAEMAPIYAKYELLLTPTVPGPAPRLGTWRTISFWQNSSLTTPFNVTGGPALAQCMGFTQAGLPLSLQLVGRPFDESSVLRAAHAYEMAMLWRRRRPSLDPGAAFSTDPPPSIRPDGRERARVSDRRRVPVEARLRGVGEARRHAVIEIDAAARLTGGETRGRAAHRRRDITCEMCGHGTGDGAVFVGHGGGFVKRQRVDRAVPQSH